MDFIDTLIIEVSSSFSTEMPRPNIPLTPEQEAKLEQLRVLVEEVGEVSFDTEVDVLIAAMTEIRDR
jgi:hypothetical protein